MESWGEVIVGNVSEGRYRIGEVSRMLNLPSYVLRFWEGEFSELRPVKSPSGQRLYTDQDISIIRKIAQLRYQEQMTLPGVKRKMNNHEAVGLSSEVIQSIMKIKNSLLDILAELR
jgi:DNA-binding transcriptional MerR regulator